MTSLLVLSLRQSSSAKTINLLLQRPLFRHSVFFSNFFSRLLKKTSDSQVATSRSQENDYCEEISPANYFKKKRRKELKSFTSSFLERGSFYYIEDG